MTKMDILLHLSRKYLLAKEEYERAVRVSIRTAPVMHDKTQFWKMMDDLRQLAYDYAMKQADGVRVACHEFVRKTFAEGGNGYDALDLPSFLRSYAKLKETLGKHLKGIIDWNEEGYLVDALPLAGQRACLRVINDEAADVSDVTKIVMEEARAFESIVLIKEQCVEQSLEEGYSEKLCEILTGDDEKFQLEMENADPPAWEDEDNG